MYHNSGVITLSTGGSKQAYSPGLNIQFSAISLFHLILPKAGFHFHLLQMRSALANSVYQLEGPQYLFMHNISRYICPISRHHRSVTFGLAGLKTADLKMAAINQRYLKLFNVRPQHQAGVLWKIQPCVQQEHTRFYPLGVRDAGSCKSMIPLFSEDSGLWRVARFQAEVWGWKWHTNGSSHMPRVWALHKQVTRARVRIASQTPENSLGFLVDSVTVGV